jgi:hypothetical protein
MAGMKTLTVAGAIVCATGLAAVQVKADDTPRVQLNQQTAHVEVVVDGELFTRYHFADPHGNRFVRPFLHPVQAADGVAVTSDQMTARGDHPHHRSIWVAHDNVNGAAHWHMKGPNPPRQRHVKFARVEADTLAQELEWEGRDGEPILRERRTLRFFAEPDGTRGIDLHSVFAAMDAPVTFGVTKEAGLCSVRVARAISANPTILNSAGGRGEPQCWGKPAAWCSQGGVIEGKPYLIAVFDHPGNPRHPTTWHVRRYGLLAANPFLDKAAGPLVIEKDAPASFRYRILVHAGDETSAKLQERYKQFAAAGNGDVLPPAP